MDISSLRAQIKAWERGFRETHARDPTVHEIKAQPAIAAKYKLYKALSKSISSAPISSSSAISTSAPVTPPRPQHASLLGKTRAVKVDPPVQTTNPFSPVKNKSRRVPTTSATDTRRTLDPARPNPFTTPTKVKHKPPRKPPPPPRELSPDPFPLIQPPQPPPRAPSAEPSTAVTRARKRLRGEPVSPSPVKEKRARVLRTFHTSSGDESSGEDAADATFVSDTPVKPHTGKPFRVLFDEITPRAQHTALKKSASRGKPALPGLFADRRGKSRALSPSSSGDEDWGALKLGGLLAANGHGAKGVAVQQKTAGNGRFGVPSVHLPGKDDLWSAVGPSKGRAVKMEDVSARALGKRPLPDDEDAADDLTTNKGMLLRVPLLPPSPPPPDTSKSSSAKYAGNNKGKGKAPATSSRKKAKLLAKIDGRDEGEFSEDEEDSLDKVKVVEHTWHRRPAPSDTETGDSEPEWDWGTHASQDGDDVRAYVPVDSGTVDVRLPEDLRQMLALSPMRETAEEESRLIQGLLYGRTARYDPGKGGEIWGAGEIVGGEEEYMLQNVGVETEEEWEGEGVPWEVGEL